MGQRPGEKPLYARRLRLYCIKPAWELAWLSRCGSRRMLLCRLCCRAMTTAEPTCACVQLQGTVTSLLYCTIALVLGGLRGEHPPTALPAVCLLRLLQADAALPPCLVTQQSPPAHTPAAGCIYANANQGSVGGIGGLSPANKAFGVLNALGSVGFACELGAPGRLLRLLSPTIVAA